MTNTIDDRIFIIGERQVRNPFTRDFAANLKQRCDLGDWIYDAIPDALEECLWEHHFGRYRDRIRSRTADLKAFCEDIRKAKAIWRNHNRLPGEVRPTTIGEIGAVLDVVDDIVDEHVEYASRNAHRPIGYPAIKSFIEVIGWWWLRHEPRSRRFVGSYWDTKSCKARGMNQASVLVFESTRLLQKVPRSTLAAYMGDIPNRTE